MTPLSDEDVDRIASRTAGRLLEGALKIAIALALAFLVVPIVEVVILRTVASATIGLPAILRLGLTASVMAIPLLILVLAWSRTRRR